jgi:hypothetical protein
MLPTRMMYRQGRHRCCTLSIVEETSYCYSRLLWIWASHRLSYHDHPLLAAPRTAFPSLSLLVRDYVAILERARRVAFGLIFGFRVSYSTCATGTVLRPRHCPTGTGPSSNSACITSAPPSSSARRRLPTQEPERVAEEATASTDAERPRQVRRTCTVLDLAFPLADAPDNGTHFIRPVR